jgi:hypothetical protein
MKNIFLDTQSVSLWHTSVSKQKLSCPICESYRLMQIKNLWFPDGASCSPRTCGEESAKFNGHALRLKTDAEATPVHTQLTR